MRWGTYRRLYLRPGFPDIPEYKRVRYLRRYMVLDGDDRCIDVRKWDIDWNSSYASRVTEFYIKYPEYEAKEHKWYKPKPGKFRQEPWWKEVQNASASWKCDSRASQLN